MKFWKLFFAISIALNLALLTLIVLAGTKVSQFMAMGAAGEAAGGPPPNAVTLGEAVRDNWEMTLASVGSVAAVEGITVRTEVAGVVDAITFNPGAEVEAGDLLVEFDRSIEEANLEQARAELDLAERTLRRTTDLFASRSIPEADLDAARSQLAAARARVESLQASLAKKSIRAPFAGRLGIKRISVGQYLNPGDAIVGLQSMSPLYVEFSMPQRQLGQLEERLVVRAQTDAFAGTTFEGRITAIDPQIDPMTRNVRVQATFENPEGRLRPGVFVDVEVVLPKDREVLMVPATAIAYSPSGNRVYVVEEKGDTLTVRQTIVRLGLARGDFVEILEGLEAGQRIVVNGAFKLREGATVVPSDVGTVEPELNPQPENS